MTLLIEDQFRCRALLHQNIFTCLVAWRWLSTLDLILFLFSGHQFFEIRFDPDISVCSLTQKCLHLHEVTRWSTEQERPFHTAFQTAVDVVEYNVITPTFKERNIPLSRSLIAVKSRLRKTLLNPWCWGHSVSIARFVIFMQCEWCTGFGFGDLRWK